MSSVLETKFQETIASKTNVGIPNGKRSTDKGYIVLIGLTGAGKSSTINSQFDLTSKTDEGCFESTTQSILEYQVESKNELGSCEKNLVVIDTPGFGDTKSSKLYVKDSQILATLEAFLLQHKELSTSYPTAVFLVIDFSDKRIGEEKSHLIQLLKAIDYLIKDGRLIDTNPTTCNLVVVLTHLMNAPEDLQKCPEPRVRLIQGLIKTFTKIPANIPIVMAENKGPDFQLTKQKLGYELPNGELYPFNLFQAFKNVAEKVDNKKVRDIIVDVFSSSATLTKRLLHDEKLVGAETVEARRYFNIIEHRDTNVPENEMTRLLQTEWGKISGQEAQSSPIVLQIAKAIFSREGIDNSLKIPTKADDIFKLVRQLTVNASLEKTLHSIGIEPPFLLDHCNSVGYFYNARNDAVSTTTPFLMNEQIITHSGFRAPPLMRVDLIANDNSKLYIGMASYESMSEYFTSRFEQLHLPSESADVGNKNADTILGHNVIPAGKVPPKLTGIREFREYSVELVAKNFQLSQSYIKTLESVPAYHENRKHIWAKHLGDGVHIIKSAFIGGSISVTATKNDNVQQKTSVDTVMSTIKIILENVGNVDVSRRFQIIEDWNFKLGFHGGDPNLVQPRLDNLFTDRGRQLFNEWKESIQLRPTLLLSEMLLEHISAYLKVGFPELADRVSLAANRTIGYDLYIKQEKNTEEENRRDGDKCCIM